MGVVYTSDEVRARGGCVLVPTMGALHEAHLALIRLGAAGARSRGLAGGCVVSVFVNPTQFNDPADFERYPRSLESDAEAAMGAGAAAVYAPSVEEVYPEGTGARAPCLPPVATEPGLEDRHRPGHFAGVYRVCKRLFELTGCGAAVFGEKDWQQLQLVRAMVERERMGVEILAGRTVRDPDGLAISSRNQHLTPADREPALSLSRALRAGGETLDPDEAEHRMRSIMVEGGAEPEYHAVRRADTLLRIRPDDLDGAGGPRVPCRVLVAARVGSTRLIDNMAWPLVGGAS